MAEKLFEKIALREKRIRNSLSEKALSKVPKHARYYVRSLFDRNPDARYNAIKGLVDLHFEKSQVFSKYIALAYANESTDSKLYLNLDQAIEKFPFKHVVPLILSLIRAPIEGKKFDEDARLKITLLKIAKKKEFLQSKHATSRKVIDLLVSGVNARFPARADVVAAIENVKKHLLSLHPDPKPSSSAFAFKHVDPLAYPNAFRTFLKKTGKKSNRSKESWVLYAQQLKSLEPNLK